MVARTAKRDFISAAVSIAVHVLLIAALVALPAKKSETFDIVDLAVIEKAKTQPVLPPPPPVPEPPKPKVKIAPKAPPPPPPPEPEPPKAPPAPPVFDLSNDTFAKAGGQGAGWALNRSEGNTKLAAVALPGQESARGTAPLAPPSGSQTGNAFQAVPTENLSKRPMPKTGAIRVPPYPVEARREGIEGAVVLHVFIDRKGRVLKARIIKDPGGGLGKVAQAAMLEENWEPGLDKKGQPVDTVITYSYRFVLES